MEWALLVSPSLHTSCIRLLVPNNESYYSGAVPQFSRYFNHLSIWCLYSKWPEHGWVHCVFSSYSPLLVEDTSPIMPRNACDSERHSRLPYLFHNHTYLWLFPLSVAFWLVPFICWSSLFCRSALASQDHCSRSFPSLILFPREVSNCSLLSLC